MLFNSTDGELRAYKNFKKEDPSYLRILWYANDFIAPLYSIIGKLKFSCFISDSNYIDELINFFSDSKLPFINYWLEYLWISDNKTFGKKYIVEIKEENFLLKENKDHLFFCIETESIGSIFIKEFSKGIEIKG